MVTLFKLQVVLLWWVCIQAIALAAYLDGNWSLIPGPENAVLESITVSANYLWGIDNRTGVGLTVADNNVVYCRRPCNKASSWKEPAGQLDQTIDANENEVWGVNNRGQIYKRAIDGSGDWIQITGGANYDCSGLCFSDASVSNNGYIWAISNQSDTYMLCGGGVVTKCGNNDQLLIDNELSLVHIEAGDEEVWGVNASNHIFKRPVNGSGEWSIVPGEMRYISASGNARIWGIAPNDSLYVCAKPCSGDWEYVGGSFKQVDGGNNSAIGVTTDNTIVAMCVEGISCNAECPTMKTTSTGSETQTISDSATYTTIIGALAGVTGLFLLLLIVSAITFSISKMLKRKRIKDAPTVKFISSQGGYLDTESGPGNGGGFENRVYSNCDSANDPEYDSIDDTNVNHGALGYDAQSKSQDGESEDFRNRKGSTPNVYTLERNTNQSVPNTHDQSGVSAAGNEATDNYEYDDCIEKDGLTTRNTEENEEYEYTNEEEFWEPASQEKELKMQVEKLTEIPVINSDSLQTHEELGSGQFGTVYRGVWQHSGSEGAAGEEVAVKSMEDGASEDDRVKFLQEAAIMGQFKNHPNILRILGIILDPPYKLVTELMHRGDLHHHLPTLRPDPDHPIPNELSPTLLSYSRQVALGLMYLGFKKYVHRDIAARNILVNSEGICKIADFGLSRDLFEEDYYVSHGGKVPVKWTAPEAINYRKYSMASDVWSYGCLLYEIWSLGVKPFHDVSNKQAIDEIDSGYRLPPPPGCPKAVYQIMIKCWHPTTASRPTPSSVVMGLSHPDFQILKWSQKDIDATSEKARTLGASLIEGHALYKRLQQTYMPSATS